MQGIPDFDQGAGIILSVSFYGANAASSITVAIAEISALAALQAGPTLLMLPVIAQLSTVTGVTTDFIVAMSINVTTFATPTPTPAPGGSSFSLSQTTFIGAMVGASLLGLVVGLGIMLPLYFLSGRGGAVFAASSASVASTEKVLYSSPNPLHPVASNRQIYSTEVAAARAGSSSIKMGSKRLSVSSIIPPVTSKADSRRILVSNRGLSVSHAPAPVYHTYDPEPEEEKSDDLPPGWVMEIDDESGDPYYVSPSGDTQWEKP
jgi:hypothetical protein